MSVLFVISSSRLLHTSDSSESHESVLSMTMTSLVLHVHFSLLQFIDSFPSTWNPHRTTSLISKLFSNSNSCLEIPPRYVTCSRHNCLVKSCFLPYQRERIISAPQRDKKFMTWLFQCNSLLQSPSASRTIPSKRFINFHKTRLCQTLVKAIFFLSSDTLLNVTLPSGWEYEELRRQLTDLRRGRIIEGVSRSRPQILLTTLLLWLQYVVTRSDRMIVMPRPTILFFVTILAEQRRDIYRVEDQLIMHPRWRYLWWNASYTISSNDTFIQNTFIQFWHFQWHFQPRHFHPTTISSNQFLIQWHFHPMTFSTNNGFIQKKITCGTINIVRVSVKASPEAGNAFTQTRLLSPFRVSTGLHVEHRRPKVGDARHEGLLKSKGGGLGV